MEMIPGYPQIFRAILVEPIPVESLAIDLDRDALVDDEVDALSYPQANLASDGVATEPQSGSGQALGEALARAIRPVHYPMKGWREVEDDALEIDRIQVPDVERPIQRSDSRLYVFIQDDSDERIEQRDRGARASFAQLPVLPVEDRSARILDVEPAMPILLRTHASRVLRKGDMERMIVAQHPTAEVPDERYPGQSATHPHRAKPRVGLWKRRVPTVTHAGDAAIANRGSQVAVASSSPNELTLLCNSAEGLDDLRDGGHRSRVAASGAPEAASDTLVVFSAHGDSVEDSWPTATVENSGVDDHPPPRCRAGVRRNARGRG